MTNQQQINVALNFTANTQQAKASMAQLQQSLTSIAAGINLNVNSTQVQSASAAAKQLAYHLNAAYNVNTGKLDLSKLNMSLNSAKTSIEGLSSKILSIGPQGQQAFVQLAQSISMAQAPVFQLNAVMNKLWTTMKNVVVYQSLSMAFQGVVSSISDAYNFAKDLNKSLTDIQIVTEYSADEMERFAKKANEAAKALSTTTTALTNASLIYFQQGLGMEEAQKRAEITVKMANVTGESVEIMSDQLTAVWNNFAKGGEHLEYYADVLTALGAATASSTDEIAEGLEKFAAVAETVGLSYEYATAALATVTATTRQSADVVGTAFKTLFARIQDLELGKTLDDGVTLGKYSAALSTIGVQILDSNGQLREMDEILNDMGSTWDNLTTAQKTATAQTVAGIRQYTQLIALMDNWDYFRENLETVAQAEGALSEQHADYAQSWEAASNRLTASLETLYNQMVDDDFFIGLTNGVAEVTDGVSNLIEKMGGIGPIITGIVGILMSSLSHKIQPAIQTVMSSLLTLTPKGAAKQAAKVTAPTTNVISEELKTGNYGISDTTSLQNSQGLMEAKNKLWTVQNKMTAAEKQQYETELNIIQLQQQRLQQSADELQSLQDQLKTKKAIADTEASDMAVVNARAKGSRGERAIMRDISTKTAEAESLGALMSSGVATDDEAIRYSLLREEIQKLNAEWQQYNRNTEEVKAATNAFVNDGVSEYERLAQAASVAGEEAIKAFRSGEAKVNLGGLTNTFFENNADSFNNLTKDSDMRSSKSALIGLKETLGSDVINQQAFQQGDKNLFDLADEAQDGEQLKGVIEQIKKALSECNIEANKLGESLSGKGQGKTIENINKNLDEQADKYKDVAEGQNRVNKSVKGFNPKHVVGFTERLSSLAGTAMTTSMALSAVSSIVQTFKDGFDITSMEDWTSVLMGLGMILPGITSMLQFLGKSVIVEVIGNMGIATTTQAAYNALIAKESVATTIATAAQEAKNAEDKEAIAIAAAEKAIKDGLITTEQKELFIQGVLGTLKKQEIKDAKESAIFTTLQTKADEGSIVAKGILAITTKARAKAEDEETAAIWRNIAAWFRHPIMWIALIIIAVVAAIVALTLAFINQNKTLDENNKAIVENSKKNLELIDSNQELADSVDNLIEKYEELKATGQSTYDTMEELKDQIPELINSYSDLENSLGIDLNLESLKREWENLKNLGDASGLIAELDRINKQIAEAELKQAQVGAAAARDRVTFAATDVSDGKVNGNGKYEVTIGGTNTQQVKSRNSGLYIGEEQAASQVLEEVMGDMWDGSKITFDANDTASVIEGYQKMAEARSKMESEFTSEELAHMDTYRELKRELGEMEESYADLLEFSNKINAAAKQDFAAGGDEDIAEEFDIQNLQDYENKREQIIESLKTKYEGLTDSQAEALLASSDLFSHYETSMELFADQGKIADELKKKGTLALESVRQWYETLPEEDKKLFLGIDFTQVGSIVEAEKELEELREKAKIAAITAEAESLEVDKNTFDTYTDILVDNNAALEKNNSLSKQIALNHIRINKGIGELAEAWDDISTIIKEGNRNTIEYAQAIGTLKNAFETAFEYAPSTKFIEDNLTKIQKLAQGDVEVLNELQDELAEDFVATLDYKTAITGNNLDRTEIQNRLNSFLDELDTTLEIGEDVEINQQFYDSLQEMLNSGQLAAEDLQKMLRMKGFEMQITGWKDVDGPKTTVTQTITHYDEDGKESGKEKQIIESQEKIQVPIINGDASGITSGSVSGNATIKRSNTSANINTSALKENKSSKDKTKNLSEETERYHEIDKTLSRLNKEYEEISKAKDRAFGQKRIDYLSQEIAKTKELAEVTRTKLVEAQRYFAADREAMISKYGMSTDKYGYITNYDEMVAKQVEAYNSDPEGQEKAYEQFKQDLANYEESIELIEDLKIQLNDYVNEELDKELEKIQYKFELEIELSDMDLERLEWQIDNLSDAVGDLSAKFDLMGRQMETNVRKANAAKTTIESILGQGGLSLADIEGKSSSELATMLEGKNFTKEQISELQTQMSNLYEYSDAMEEIMDSVSDNLVASFEDMNKELDKSVDKLDHMNSMIDAYRNIIDLAGADALGISDELLERMSEAQYNIANSNIEIAKAQLTQNKAALESLQERINAAQAAGDTKAVEELQEAYDEIYATVQDNELALLEATSSALEARTQLFETEMNNIIKTFEDAMTGAYGTFNAMQEAFDQQKEINDRYIDDYQKIYELSKLNRDLVNSIDDTDSIRAKERLRDLQAEINELQESNTQMTQYEVDELRARYELRLAEIALEEAQNAKSTVRMSRDSEGNWGYVYTADEAAVGDAQQNYEDKLYAYQQMLYEYTDEMQARLVQIPAEYAEAIRAIYEDQTLNDEERRLRIEETAEYYQGMYDHVIQQLGLVNEDAKILYEQDWNAYSETTGYKISKDEEWVDSFEETIASQITGYTSLEDAQWAFKDASDQMLTELENRYVDYREDVKETLDLAIDDVDKFVGDDTTEGSLAYYLKIAEEAAGDAAAKAKDMGEANKTAFETAAKAAAENLTKYSATVTEWNKQTESITTAIGTLIAEYAKLSETLEGVVEDYEEVNTAKAKYESSVIGGGNNTTDNNIIVSDAKGGWMINGKSYYSFGGKWYNSSDIPSNALGLNDSGFLTIDSSILDLETLSALDPNQILVRANGPNGEVSGWYNGPNDKEASEELARRNIKHVSSTLSYVKDLKLPSFDTGGYTGTWDASGRLAMLHQKELVLNASDTANFLTAVDILRDITKVIDLQALSQSNALSALSAASVGTSAQVIEQEVTIHAEFPNATERSEIEAAFDTLLNRASQFANRKNK